jgi:hypothetical protein
MEQETDFIHTQCIACGAKSNFDTLNVFEHHADDGCPEEYT